MAGYMQVIKIGKKDIPDVLMLLKEINPNIDESEIFKVLINRMESPYFLYLFARLDNKPVGIMECHLRKEVLLTGPKEYGIIQTIYVLPEARRNGIGSKLWQIANIWLKNSGAADVWILSGPRNEGLNPFLQKIGFAPDQAKFTKKLID